MELWQLLIQFVFRLTFGVALAMGVTPAKHVTSGFYRVHLWVLLGLNTFGALVVYSQREAFADTLMNWPLVLGLAIDLVVITYVGSVVWLYEKVQLGSAVIQGVAALALMAAIFATPWANTREPVAVALAILDLVSSGVLLGVTLAAMLLGHWYLNTPTMELLPLRRLVMSMTVAILVRTLVSGAGLALQLGNDQSIDAAFWIFVTFRWLSGLLGTLTVALMTWYTLKVPNTQSATGILYAGVILAFLGELTSMLLSVDTLYPL
ncbi:MAG: hypothetical protein CMJ64_28485 [Planctomycetaceae bacterium]|nr:hypothetical protein [Planctomycetaceae bacterium]